MPDDDAPQSCQPPPGTPDHSLHFVRRGADLKPVVAEWFSDGGGSGRWWLTGSEVNYTGHGWIYCGPAEPAATTTGLCQRSVQIADLVVGRSIQALDDWALITAPDLRDLSHVCAARMRILHHGGTLAYIKTCRDDMLLARSQAAASVRWPWYTPAGVLRSAG